MTIENCIRLLKVYQDRIDNPQGRDGNENKSIVSRSKVALADMKRHILKCRKFIGHPIVAELTKEVKEDRKVEKKVESKKEKEDGKKSKG